MSINKINLRAKMSIAFTLILIIIVTISSILVYNYSKNRIIETGQNKMDDINMKVYDLRASLKTHL